MMPVIDFERDYKEIVSSKLMSYGWKGNPNLKNLDILLSNYELRRIPQRPRKAHISRSLRCPRNLENGLALIISKIEKGQDLNPHLSRGMKKVHYNDLFLFDWGIHHLHLGIEIEEDGYCKRTGHVLFVIFEDDDALLIDVRLHGRENPQVWFQRDILDIIRVNWPSWIKRFQYKNSVHENGLSEADLKILRVNKHTNTLIKLSDGKSYMAPGMGITAAGTAIKATIKADKTWHLIEQFELNIKSQPNTYKRMFWPHLCKWPERFSIKLINVGENFYAVATFSKIALSVYIAHTPTRYDYDVIHRSIVKMASSNLHFNINRKLSISILWS
jgi:hypothetical protein